jgi:hypothetical protein
MRPDFVVLVAKPIERTLLPTHRATRRHARGLLQRQVHPLVPSVLLRLSGIDPLQLDAQARPPRRELGESSDRRGRCERLPIVGTNRFGQTVAAKQLVEDRLHICERRLVKSNAREQEARRCIHHGERVANATVPHRELALEVHAPDVVRLATARERLGARRYALAETARLDQAVALEDVSDGAGRGPLVVRPVALQELAQRHRAPPRMLLSPRQDQPHEFRRCASRASLRPTGVLRRRLLEPCSFHPLVSSLAGNSECPAERRLRQP